MTTTSMQFGQSTINVVLNEGQLPAKLSTDANGNTVLEGAVGIKCTGYDQTTEIQEYFNDVGKGAVFADFGPGDFIITSDITIVPRRVSEYEASYGFGLNVRGVAPNITRLIDARSTKSTPLILFTDPTGFQIQKRNNMMLMENLSILSSNTSGVPNDYDDLDGVGIMVVATVGSGYGAFVTQWSKLHRVILSGYEYPISLDDTTYLEVNNVHIPCALEGIRLGGNVDDLFVTRSSFGSEAIGTDYKTSFIALKTGWAGGVVTLGGENNLRYEDNWHYGIGKVIEFGASAGELKFKHNYMERVQEYVKTNGNTINLVDVEGNHFSGPNLNDTSGYKFDFGSTGNIHFAFRNNTSAATPPTNAWVHYEGPNNHVHWDGHNYMTGVHLSYTNSGTTRTYTLPDNGSGNYHFAGLGGVERVSGDLRYVAKTNTGTVTLHWSEGDVFQFGAQTGNTTIYMTSGSPIIPSQGTRVRIELKAAAASAGSYTYTFDSSWFFPYTFTQPVGGNENKQCVIELERMSSGWIVVSPQNVWL